MQLWALLEADPTVSRYCERPALVQTGGCERLIDFWVQRDKSACWLLIGNESESSFEDAADPADRADDRPHVQAQQIQWVSRAGLDAEHVWIDNWLSILPYIAAHAELLDAALIEQVMHQCRVPTRLEAIEWQHARVENVLVRTAVFVALHRGRLSAPALRERRWDLTTQFVVNGRAQHASKSNP